MKIPYPDPAKRFGIDGIRKRISNTAFDIIFFLLRRAGALFPERHPGVHQAGLQLRQPGPQRQADREPGKGGRIIVSHHFLQGIFVRNHTLAPPSL